jgi:two-component system, chemotaxis family, CheB/CheR fusion protein
MTANHPSTGSLVVVGASAGGIEAISILVGSLPTNFSAPVVLAQHLDPNRPSFLASVLERRTTLPVVGVEGPTKLEQGKVYVVPSNRHVVIEDGQVNLQADHADRPRPSVDLLLSTAAASYGERLVAVILTGAGSDGAAGAVDVKDAGGVVVIQNPQTARYPSMPMALPPTAVDHVVDIEKIGALLNDLVQREARVTLEPKPDDDALRHVTAILSRQANIDFRPYKPATLLRRIGRRMFVTHTHNLEEYAHFLDAHPQEVAELVMTLLIKVTEFFRDPEAFTVLHREVLPQLLEGARERGRLLRLWSAGCATGEEAYSLALVLADLLGPEMADWTIKIFATDLDESAVAFARRGLYPPNVLKKLPPEYLARYFEVYDQGYRISKTLRQLVIFGQQDLSRGVPCSSTSSPSCNRTSSTCSPTPCSRPTGTCSWGRRRRPGPASPPSSW